jgi:hypothetical protein
LFTNCAFQMSNKCYQFFLKNSKEGARQKSMLT